MTAGPPWLEITTDDYASRNDPDSTGGAAWNALTKRARELEKGQHAGFFRVSLVLREAGDVDARFDRRPDRYWHDATGSTLVMC